MDNRTLKTRWDSLEMGAKFILILCGTTAILQLFFGNTMMENMINDLQLTVGQLQLWRIISSFLINGNGIGLLINLPLAFYMLLLCIPDIERRFSTVYIILEYLLQIFISNIFLVTFGYPLITLSIFQSFQLYGFGITPLVFNFLWQAQSLQPQKTARLCMLPWEISLKFIPWGYLLVLVIIGHPLLPNLLYCFLGCYQHCFKHRLIPLPFVVYAAFEKIVPQFVKNFECFIKIVNTEKELKMVSTSCCDFEPNVTGEVMNMAQIERVIASQQGQAITSNDSRESSNFKEHWAKNEEDTNQNSQIIVSAKESDAELAEDRG